MKLIQQLALKLDKCEDEVYQFLLSAPKMYKVYTIPKRTSGHRVIAQPSKELKKYQRLYLELQKLPIHNSAMAYRSGYSIKDNAKKHKDNPYLLKLDLENFFNSITSRLFWDIWKLSIPLPSLEDQIALEKLLFWCPSKTDKGSLILSIGAPSSPLVSNFFMYKFDCIMSQICSDKKISYTRYADDLTFSTKKKDYLFDIPLIVQENLSIIFGGAIRINRKKTTFSSKAHNRHITGITITNGGDLSLGRKRKRYIKHLIHQAALNNLNEDDKKYLKGLISFSKHIEPKFIISLEKKYSSKLINSIFGE